MEVVSICDNCKNLVLKTTEPCQFCGFRRKSYGSAFVVFIVILMVLVLAVTIFGMRRFQSPDADNNFQKPASSEVKRMDKQV